MTSWSPYTNLRLAKLCLLLPKKGVKIYVHLCCSWFSVEFNCFTPRLAIIWVLNYNATYHSMKFGEKKIDLGLIQRIVLL